MQLAGRAIRLRLQTTARQASQPDYEFEAKMQGLGLFSTMSPGRMAEAERSLRESLHVRGVERVQALRRMVAV